MARPARAHPSDARSQSIAVTAFTREVHQREVTFTCQTCGRTVTQVRFPGPLPQYCNELCRIAGSRLHTADRMQRLRERRKAAQPSLQRDAMEHDSVT
jgi:hypothetical protein